MIIKAVEIKKVIIILKTKILILQQFSATDEKNCLPLSSLNPMMSSNWRAKARVTQKSLIQYI